LKGLTTTEDPWFMQIVNEYLNDKPVIVIEYPKKQVFESSDEVDDIASMMVDIEEGGGGHKSQESQESALRRQVERKARMKNALYLEEDIDEQWKYRVWTDTSPSFNALVKAIDYVF
jgi:hypothetical protein